MHLDHRRVGLVLRALRLRLGLRQIDVAAKAGLSQQLVSLAELGRLALLTLRAIRRIASVLGASYDGEVRWRGGAVDRLLDEAHALVVGEVVRILNEAGWRTHVEVTYSHFAERGSIDVVGERLDLDVLLFVEVKSEITSAEETRRRLDTKVPLAPKIARERFGRSYRYVVPILVVLDTATSRRRLERHASMFSSAFPISGRAVRSWLRRPTPVSGVLWFL